MELLYWLLFNNENYHVMFLNDLGSSDFESWILVNKAFQKYAKDEDIMECGFKF